MDIHKILKEVAEALAKCHCLTNTARGGDVPCYACKLIELKGESNDQ